MLPGALCGDLSPPKSDTSLRAAAPPPLHSISLPPPTLYHLKFDAKYQHSKKNLPKTEADTRSRNSHTFYAKYQTSLPVRGGRGRGGAGLRTGILWRGTSALGQRNLSEMATLSMERTSASRRGCQLSGLIPAGALAVGVARGRWGAWQSVNIAF